MPRHCVTYFNEEKCRTNYPATKKLPAGDKLPVYRFPRNEQEQKRWLESLPNVPTLEISDHVGICAKHFPPDSPTRPTVPPYLFGNTNPLFFAQTLNSTPRNVDQRNVSASSRSENTRKLEEELDKIDSWSSMVDYCQKKFTPELLVDTSVEKVLRLVKLTAASPPSVEFSIVISDDYHVEAYKGTQKVAIRDLVEGFHITVQKYSHIDNVVDRMKMKESDFDPQAEIRAVGEEVFRISDDITVEEIESWSEEKQRQLQFIGRQLLALGTRNYSVENMKDAIDLYLRSRSSYNALRKLLVLPNRNTLLNYFGKLGVAGAEEECNKLKKYSLLWMKDKSLVSCHSMRYTSSLVTASKEDLHLGKL